MTIRPITATDIAGWDSLECSRDSCEAFGTKRSQSAGVMAL